jgi:fructose-1,6-bisphosphatase II
MGVRIILIADGDIASSIVTCLPDSGVDLLVGAGAEAIIAATAVKCLGRTKLVKVWKDKKDDTNRTQDLKQQALTSRKPIQKTS